MRIVDVPAEVDAALNKNPPTTEDLDVISTWMRTTAWDVVGPFTETRRYVDWVLRYIHLIDAWEPKPLKKED